MKLIILRRVINRIPLLEVVDESKLHEALPTIFFYHGWQSKKNSF